MQLDVIAFRMAKQVLALADAAASDIVFTPTITTWQGRYDVELHLRAIRSHTAYADDRVY